MQLYIVRHADAGQRGDPEYPDDDLRPLTKKGRKQFSRLVKKLAKRGFMPALVVTSPLVRCRQTADALAERVCPAPQIVELDALRPASRLDELVRWSNDQKLDTIAWVGHAPDVDQLAAELVAGHAEAFRFAKGAVAAIEFDEEIVIGNGILRWFVTPKLLGD